MSEQNPQHPLFPWCIAPSRFYRPAAKQHPGHTRYRLDWWIVLGLMLSVPACGEGYLTQYQGERGVSADGGPQLDRGQVSPDLRAHQGDGTTQEDGAPTADGSAEPGSDLGSPDSKGDLGSSVDATPADTLPAVDFSLMPDLPTGDLLVQPPLADDPAIISLLDGLGDNTAARLPDIKSENMGITSWNFHDRGPGHRDFCNKMVYAPDRQTALYAGGNHASPHRLNDAWEYHLGSNTWRLLFKPVGGNHKNLRNALSNWKKDASTLTAKQQQEVADFRAWGKKYMVIEDGYIVLEGNAPFMPSHTWDALTYDPPSKQLIWPNRPHYRWLRAGLYAWMHEVDEKTVQAQLRDDHTNMWFFDPIARRWSPHFYQGARPALLGMGCSMVHVSHLEKNVYYCAAQNVTPPEFEQWLYDAVADKWEKMAPNGGTSVRTLAYSKKIAPPAEAQLAYSPRHKKIVAVQGQNTFVYDFAANAWSKLLTDARMDAADNKTIFAYDVKNDVFLLAQPKKSALILALSLRGGGWQEMKHQGAGFLKTKFGGYMGYYDSRHNVLAIQGRYNKRFWVYRYAN